MSTTVNLNDFALSRKSSYLRSLLDPFSGSASIPDDVSARHVTKSETITNNLRGYQGGTSTTCDGLYVFYLNHPTEYIGAHYVFNTNTGYYEFDTYIKTAQILSKSYDYARSVSCAVKIISNTISTTNFTISGTFNAVTLDGSLTELGFNPNTISPSTFYEQVLSGTNNLMDKIGNVLMAHGITAIGLPTSFNIPFTRMGDHYPLENFIQNVRVNAEIVDGSQELIYTSRTIPGEGTFTIQPGESQAHTVDSFTGPVEVSLAVTRKPGSPNVKGVVFLEVFSPFGVTIRQLAQPFISNDSSDIDLFFVINETEPIGRVLVSYEISDGELSGCTQLDNLIRVPNGARPGVQSPTTVVCYNGFPRDARMTISGVKNFELIPNPELRKNIQTMYSHYDPNELVFVKKMLSRRDQLQIRTVMTTPMYESNLALYREYSDLDKHDVAEAFDIKDIVRAIKSLAVPAISAYVPELAPAAKTIDNLLDDMWLNKRANAASGWYGMDQKDLDIISLSSSESTPFEQIDAQVLNTNTSILEEPIISATHLLNLKTDIRDTPYCVLFPVVFVTGGVVQKAGLYGVIPGKHLNLLGFNARAHKAQGPRYGYAVYGYAHDLPRGFTLPMDMTIIKVAEFNDHFITIPVEAPYVAGSSAEAAIKMLCHMIYDGEHYRFDRGEDAGVYGPITGAVAGNKVQPNFMYNIKRAYCTSQRLPLVGSDHASIDLRKAWNLCKATHETIKATKGPIVAKIATIMPDLSFEVALAMDDDLMSKFGALLKQTMEPINARLDRLENARQSRPREKISTTKVEEIYDEYDYNADNYEEYEEDIDDVMRNNPPRNRSVSFGRNDVREFVSGGSIPNELTEAINSALAKNYRISDLVKILSTLPMRSRVRGPSTEENQMAKAALKSELQGIDVNWVMKNGARGMTQDQKHYLTVTGQLPPPSKDPRGRFYSDTMFKNLNGVPVYGTLQRPAGAPLTTRTGRSRSSRRKALWDEKFKRIVTSQSSNPRWNDAVEQALYNWMSDNNRAPGPEEMKALLDAHGTSKTPKIPPRGKLEQSVLKREEPKLQEPLIPISTNPFLQAPAIPPRPKPANQVLTKYQRAQQEAEMAFDENFQDLI